MLISLRASLQADMLACIHQSLLELRKLADHVDFVEWSMDDFTANYNTLVEAHAIQSEDIAWIKAKVEDLIDRSRRKKMKFLNLGNHLNCPILYSIYFWWLFRPFHY